MDVQVNFFKGYASEYNYGAVCERGEEFPNSELIKNKQKKKTWIHFAQFSI